MSDQSNSGQSIISQAIGNFHGGIHPPQYKTLSNQVPIQSLALANKLVIPMQQNIGKAAVPIVKVGDSISTGQIIAINNSAIGANIHAPANGIIYAIQACNTGHASGLFKQVIIIHTKPDEQQISDKTTKQHWKTETKQTLQQRIKQAGIVGLGGATFPTDIKTASQSIETLIVNAMECEPYITCDDRLLQEQAELVIEGALITAFIVHAKEIIFAIEDNKPEALAALEIAIVKKLSTDELATNADQQTTEMRIVVAPTKYPSGGEKQIVELVVAKQIPSGQLPASIGILVQNIATLFAIYNAVVCDQPLINRLVTITGNLVKQPGNFWIPLGTPIDFIIQHFEIPVEQCKKIIIGGPLMGQSINDFSTPVTKSTNCIIFNGEDKQQKLWLTASKDHLQCIRCGDCEKVCPADLLPQQLYWFSQSEQWEPLEKQGLFDCIDCGACAYVCPSEIPLVDYFRFGKSTIENNRIKQKDAALAKQRFDFREMRLQRVKDETALKHQKAADDRRKAAKNKDHDPSGKQTAINQALERVKQKKTQQEKNKAED